ncbi:MAG: hypothetical protein RLN90_01630 [Balneolaceae bacterium]
MSIEEIEIEELREFAVSASNDGFNAEWVNGALTLNGHESIYDCEVYWEKGNELWKISNLDNKKYSIIIPVGELVYSTGIFY